MDLLITAPAARALGARQIVLVCPYLAYMRQDMAFTPGEAVSQRHIAALLASQVDGLITVDPHLHRIQSLAEVMPGCRSATLSAAPLLGAWVARQVPGALLLGPDEEALQWVSAAGRGQGLDFAVCHKQRFGDRDVRVALPDLPLQGRAVVLMDDVASTGRTLIEAAQGRLGRRRRHGGCGGDPCTAGGRRAGAVARVRGASGLEQRRRAPCQLSGGAGWPDRSLCSGVLRSVAWATVRLGV